MLDNHETSVYSRKKFLYLYLSFSKNCSKLIQENQLWHCHRGAFFFSLSILSYPSFCGHCLISPWSKWSYTFLIIANPASICFRLQVDRFTDASSDAFLSTSRFSGVHGKGTSKTWSRQHYQRESSLPIDFHVYE